MATGIHFQRLKRSDLIYCPLPLYHTAGGVISVGQAFVLGCTVALKTKFSASQYFPDCIKFNATVCEIDDVAQTSGGRAQCAQGRIARTS